MVIVAPRLHAVSSEAKSPESVRCSSCRKTETALDEDHTISLAAPSRRLKEASQSLLIERKIV